VPRADIHPTSPFPDRAGKVSLGAGGRVPAAKAERPLSVQSTDLRGDAGQRARRADSGRSPNRDQTFGLVAVIRRGELIVLIENNVVVHTDLGMIWLGGRSDEVRK
jgi:hypothetical protein